MSADSAQGASPGTGRLDPAEPSLGARVGKALLSLVPALVILGGVVAWKARQPVPPAPPAPTPSVGIPGEPDPPPSESPDVDVARAKLALAKRTYEGAPAGRRGIPTLEKARDVCQEARALLESVREALDKKQPPLRPGEPEPVYSFEEDDKNLAALIYMIRGAILTRLEAEPDVGPVASPAAPGGPSPPGPK